jgi:hypothetical protein
MARTAADAHADGGADARAGDSEPTDADSRCGSSADAARDTAAGFSRPDACVCDRIGNHVRNRASDRHATTPASYVHSCAAVDSGSRPSTGRRDRHHAGQALATCVASSMTSRPYA